MNQITKLKNIFTSRFYTTPVNAYKKWAADYDCEANNLMLIYDSLLLGSLLTDSNLKNKHIIDFGCGTGRNWDQLQKHNPAKITGCDISKEMLKMLKDKWSGADTHLIRNDKLHFLKNKSFDILVSTLVIAHIKNIEKTFSEWDRILRDNAEIILTDFHPSLLENGGERTFRHEGKTVKIRNYVHRIPEIENLLARYGFKVDRKIEYKIDEGVKAFYEDNNAVKVYNEFYGANFIYGIRLSR